mgnify:CR=1 FL=1
MFVRNLVLQVLFKFLALKLQVFELGKRQKLTHDLLELFQALALTLDNLFELVDFKLLLLQTLLEH